MSLSYKKLSDMTKPRLAKVRALFYVLQQLIKRGCAYFDTAPIFNDVGKVPVKAPCYMFFLSL